MNPLDRVQPLATSRAGDGMVVHITRVAYKDRKWRETKQPVLRYKPTTAIPAGKVQTADKGQPGILEIRERTWFVDGKPSTKKVSQRVVQPLHDNVIALGTRKPFMPGRVPYHNRYAMAYMLSARGGSPRDRWTNCSDPTALRPVKSITIATSAYVAGRCGGSGTHTATGMPCQMGAVATDPRVIPLGTKLYIEGYGYAFACDTGGAIKGNRVDLAFDSYSAAIRHGRRQMRAWILGP